MTATDKAACQGIAGFVVMLIDKANAGETLTPAAILATAEHMVYEMGGDWAAFNQKAGLSFDKARGEQ